jgi:hypothetical protein
LPDVDDKISTDIGNHSQYNKESILPKNDRDVTAPVMMGRNNTDQIDSASAKNQQLLSHDSTPHIAADSKLEETGDERKQDTKTTELKRIETMPSNLWQNVQSDIIKTAPEGTEHYCLCTAKGNASQGFRGFLRFHGTFLSDVIF